MKYIISTLVLVFVVFASVTITKAALAFKTELGSFSIVETYPTGTVNVYRLWDDMRGSTCYYAVTNTKGGIITNLSCVK